jgi:hypothetical protein
MRQFGQNLNTTISIVLDDGDS